MHSTGEKRLFTRLSEPNMTASMKEEERKGILITPVDTRRPPCWLRRRRRRRRRRRPEGEAEEGKMVFSPFHGWAGPSGCNLFVPVFSILAQVGRRRR